MGFFRQEYWSGLAFLPPGDFFSQPWIHIHVSCIAGGFFTTEPLGKPYTTLVGGIGSEIKRRLLFGRKAMTNLDRVLKTRDITLPTKVCIVNGMGFSSHVQM